jgi:hypothetical protein
MSYHVSIGSFEGNYTWNSLSPLCYVHLSEKNGLRSLDGMTGREACDALRSFWDSVHGEKLKHWAIESAGEPEFCKKYDSPNGWGSTVGALIFMGQLTAACAAHPRHKVRVCA